MRFITEFESTYEGVGHPEHKKYISAYEGRGQMDLGFKIAELFGWKADEQRFKIHHSLEIEAFPIDKWMEFKKVLEKELMSNDPDINYVFLSLEKLESFGKPSEDTITNQQLNK